MVQLFEIVDINIGCSAKVYELSPLPGPRVPSVVRKSNCVFPDWLAGGWEDMEVSGGSLTYKDKVTFQTFSSDCVQKSYKHPNRYLIYSRTHWYVQSVSRLYINEAR